MENNNEIKEIEINESNLEVVNGGQTPGTTQVTGLKCPQCSAFIPTTIQEIIVSSCIVCPNCSLRINIDRSKNSKAIDALRKVKAAEEKLKEKKES